MKRSFCIAALAVGNLLADKKPEPTYPNTKTYPVSCDAVWARIVPVIAKNALVPESSDRAGGFMRLRYTRGDQRGSLLALTRSMDQVTLKQGRPGGMYSLFRVNGGTLTAVDGGGSCTVTVQMEYSGYKNPRESFGDSGWMAFQSNGLLESTILENMALALK